MCSLVLQTQVLDYTHDFLVFSSGEGGGGGIAGHEVVEDGEGDCAAGFVEKDAGEEETEGRVGEGFLDEAEASGG